MQSDKKKVLANSLMYTSGNILLRFFSFLLIPLYTAFLVPEQYGIVNLAFGFVNVFSCIIMMGLQYSVVRFYADFKHDKNKVAQLISTIICVVSIIGSMMVVILILSNNLWNNLLFKRIAFLPVVLLAILISFVSALYNLYQESLKGMQQAKKSVLLSYVFFLLMLGSNILTVVVLKQGATGILTSTFAINLLMVLMMIIDLRKQKLLYFCINKDILKQLLKYSLPLLPHSLSFNISNFFTRIIINSKMTASMLGFYSLASQFGGVADVVSNSVQSAFQPWLFSKLNETSNNNQNYDEIRNLTSQLLWLYGLIYLVIGAFAEEAINIMTNIEYHSAWTYVPLLIMSVAIKSPLHFYQNFMYYHKEMSKYIFLCTMAGCFLSMLLVWFMIPIWGVYGAILADIIALILRLFITKSMLKHKNTIYSFNKIIAITIIPIIWLGITVLPSYVNLFTSWYYSIGYKVILCIGYIIMVIILNKGISKVLIDKLLHR